MIYALLVLIMVGIFAWELGREEGYKIGFSAASKVSAEFFKHCIPNEYLKFLDDNNIPTTEEFRKEFMSNPNVYTKHKIINDIREVYMKKYEEQI